MAICPNMNHFTKIKAQSKHTSGHWTCLRFLNKTTCFPTDFYTSHGIWHRYTSCSWCVFLCRFFQSLVGNPHSPSPGWKLYLVSCLFSPHLRNLNLVVDFCWESKIFSFSTWVQKTTNIMKSKTTTCALQVSVQLSSLIYKACMHRVGVEKL